MWYNVFIDIFRGVLRSDEEKRYNVPEHRKMNKAKELRIWRKEKDFRCLNY